MAEQFTSLRPNKRYITTHDANGKSIYTGSSDQQYNAIPGVGGVARSFAVESFPVKMKDEADINNYNGNDSSASRSKSDIVIPTGGVNCVVVDFQPDGMSPMHRTVSMDYSICVMGEIEHELDSGEVVTLRPGDHIVQRGTNHLWRNASKTEPARFVAVTLAAEPFEIPNFGMLKEVHEAPVKKDANESKI